MGHKFAVFTNRKRHVGLRSVTLNDLEQPNDRHFALFHTMRQLSKPMASNSLKSDLYCQRQNVA